jgi:asparagine synthase (glutamine-hydrolysing)
MCGICGYTKKPGDSEGQEQIEAMLNLIQHRGPDYLGNYIDEKVCLGHARLSIIDLSAEANQPFTLSGRYVMCYNGETYNYKELRDELIQLGYSFSTNSDTEVVLRGYMHFGTGFFSKMNGMFAMSIYDRERAEVLLVRDRFGIKPLYYLAEDVGLIFGSEIKAVTARSGAKPVDKNGLSEFLYFGNALGSRSMHEGIAQVPPGNCLTYNLNTHSRQVKAFWSLESVKPAKHQELNSVREELLTLLEKGVKRHLVSDVPVGIFLSGGIDSSLIAHYASKHLGKQITAYTASFEYSKVDETKVAKRYAQDLGMEHQMIRIETKGLPDIIEKLVHHFDSPFSDAANIPLYLMTREVSTKHKVILQGDGGDEFFGGYRRYSMLAKYSNGLQLSLIRSILPFLFTKPVLRERLKRVVDIFSLKDDAEKMGRLLTTERPAYSPYRILSESMRSELAEYDPFYQYRQMNERFAGKDSIQKMLFTDSQIILPNIFLEKVDRATMANGVEVRIPFLDNDLTGFALGLDSSIKLLHKKQKGLLLAAVQGVLPQYILDRKKTGFSVPFENWIRKPLKEMFFDTLNAQAIVDLSLYNQKEVEHCYRLHEQRKSDKGFLLWKILNLNIWLLQTKMKLN